jgi:hypothetical protein
VNWLIDTPSFSTWRGIKKSPLHLHCHPQRPDELVAVLKDDGEEAEPIIVPDAVAVIVPFAAKADDEPAAI